MTDDADTPGSGRQGRLTPIDQARELLPWRRAEQLDRCFLYWAPVAAFPIPEKQREWLNAFFGRFIERMTSDGKLRAELFLDYPTALDRSRDFQKTARKFSPLFGLHRKPGAPITPPPDVAEMQQDASAFLSGEKKPPTMKEIAPDYCYWFVMKHEQEQRELFFGHGGMTMIFLEPDPNTVPPPEASFVPDAFYAAAPTVKKEEVEAAVAGAYAMTDKFLAKSKELFGEGLEEEPIWPGIFYIVPALSSASFFEQKKEIVQSWFELFSIYVTESVADKGILLGAKEDVTAALVEVLGKMRDDGLSYPVIRS